jgi:hypothetical protein
MKLHRYGTYDAGENASFECHAELGSVYKTDSSSITNG